MQLYEGDKVEVAKIISDIDMVQVKFGNNVGVFPSASMKLVKNKETTQRLTFDQSNRHPLASS